MDGYQVPIRVIYARRGTLEVDKQNERILLHIYDAHYEERDEADGERPETDALRYQSQEGCPSDFFARTYRQGEKQSTSQ